MRKTLLSAAVALTAAIATATAGPTTNQRKTNDAKEAALATISIDAAKAHIGFLASDELRGRKAGTNDAQVAAQYIIAHLREWGIKPLADQLPATADSCCKAKAEECNAKADGCKSADTGCNAKPDCCNAAPRPSRPTMNDSYTQPFSAYSMEWQKRKPWYVEPDSVAKLTAGTHRRLDMKNVLAMIPGRRSDEYVVVGAHFDHVGDDPSLVGDKVYNGADDNASGVSAALQIARAFAVSGVQPERNIVFAFWDGEELGLLGSRRFMLDCPFADKIKGYLNFDMIGRNNKPENPPYVVYFYTAAHPVFGDWLKGDIKRYKLNLDPDYRAWDNPVGGSDNGTFAKRGIPIIWYHTDGHPDYHQPGDEAEKINYEKVADITRAAFLNAWNLANEKTY